MNVDLLIMIASMLGTIAFSISGALIAIEWKLDIFGVVILGCTTACGGGIVRDAMLNTSIAMFDDPIYVLVSALTSLGIFIFMYFFNKTSWQESKIYKNFFIITDSIGLGAFVVVGMNACLNAGYTSMFALCFYGVLTAVGGGLIRDVMVNKIPAVLRKHIYAVAAIIGAIYFYLLNQNFDNYTFNVISTVLIVVIIRYLAYYFELSLPKVKLK